jgi:hypothetical protein
LPPYLIVLKLHSNLLKIELLGNILIINNNEKKKEKKKEKRRKKKSLLLKICEKTIV